MKIKKLIAKGLTLAILLSNIPISSFANEINLKENKLEVKNSSSSPEISPQMLSVIASIAVGVGITLTTEDDVLDIARLVYDNYQGQKEDIETIFKESVFININGVVEVGKEFLDICKSSFDSILSPPGSDGVSYVGNIAYKFGLPSTNNIISSMGEYTDFWELCPGIPIKYSDLSVGKLYKYNAYYSFKLLSSKYVEVYYNDVLVGQIGPNSLSSYFKVFIYNGDFYLACLYTVRDSQYLSLNNYPDIYRKIASNDILSFDIPYNGGYDWDNIGNNTDENGSIEIYIPGNASSLVGQAGGYTIYDGINAPSYELINPCTQEIIIPEINNPSINIGESVRLQTNVNCSVYDAQLLVQKAEQSNELTDIENARNEVNKLPESTEKENLQNRLDAIIPNLALDVKNTTANLDVYIKSENMLLMSLPTNSTTFEDYSGVEEIEKSNAITVNINSSLTYDLNAYLVGEIQNADGSNKIDIDRLNIKANDETAYQEFAGVNQKLTLKSNCSAGNDLTHNIDLKLNGDDAYPADIYKTVIKFEAEQK